MNLRKLIKPAGPKYRKKKFLKIRNSFNTKSDLIKTPKKVKSKSKKPLNETLPNPLSPYSPKFSNNVFTMKAYSTKLKDLPDESVKWDGKKQWELLPKGKPIIWNNMKFKNRLEVKRY
jgi:hypothetical protein